VAAAAARTGENLVAKTTYLFMGEYTFSMDVGGSGLNSITLLDTGVILPRPGASRLSEFRLYRVLQDGAPSGEYVLRTSYVKLQIGGTSFEGEFPLAFQMDGDRAVGIIGIEASRLQMSPPEIAQEVRLKFRDQFLLVREGKFWLQPADSMYANATWKVKRTLGPSYAGGDLRAVDLRASLRRDEDFTGAKLGKASLANTEFRSCKFDRADLTEANCSGARFGVPGQAPSSMTGAVFIKTDLDDAQFHKCPLAGANFKGTSFGNATLSGAIMEGSILDDADLRAVQFAPNDPPRFHAADPKPDGKKTSLVKTKLKASLLGSDWTLLDLTDAAIDDIPTAIPLLKANYSLLGPLDLSGRNLTQADFTGSTLKDVKFNGANLTSAVLASLDLRSTTLTGATLTDADLSRANLKDMTIDAAVLTRIKMLATDCTQAKLGTCTAAEPGIFSRDPNERRTCFAKATIPAALLGLDWQALDLGDATISNLPVDLTKLDARYALLHGINLSDKILIEAKFDHAELRRGSLANSDLTSATFNKASLQGVEGENPCSLSKAFMKNAVFDDANLTGVNATYVYFYDLQASVARAVLAGCDFSNAYLSGVNFSGVRDGAMQGVKFNGACLINADFNGVKFSNYGQNSSSLSNACLQGVNFTNATLSGTFMRDAAVSLATGKFDVTRRLKYRGPLEPTKLAYKVTEIDPASATSGSTECPTAGNGPCTGGKLISPNAPKSWTDTSGT
jgi:uncharacterized protein YjbI with pentapeptide repeats